MTPLDLTDLSAEMATLALYVAGAGAIILSAYGFKYGWAAGWKAVKSALGITTSPAKGR